MDITIISNTGSVINSFPVPHFPDGLAFGDGAASTALFSNNNDGSITRYVLGPGYLGAPVITDIALQTKAGKAYGDLLRANGDAQKRDDAVRAIGLPDEADSPLVIDAYAELSCPVALQFFKPVSRDSKQVLQVFCFM